MIAVCKDGRFFLERIIRCDFGVDKLHLAFGADLYEKTVAFARDFQVKVVVCAVCNPSAAADVVI